MQKKQKNSPFIDHNHYFVKSCLAITSPFHPLQLLFLQSSYIKRQILHHFRHMISLRLLIYTLSCISSSQPLKVRIPRPRPVTHHYISHNTLRQKQHLSSHHRHTSSEPEGLKTKQKNTSFIHHSHYFFTSERGCRFRKTGQIILWGREGNEVVKSS